MFLEQAFSQHASGAVRVLDACAAPGGKSTHLQTLIGAAGLLVSNEVIRTRVGVLSENLQRWGGSNVVVSAADPRAFVNLPGFFDVLLVDAPCSGSGLFRREPEAVQEWSPEQVELCGARQQRILGDLWGALKEGGLLMYSTCSYSPRENEDILDWLCGAYALESLPLTIDPVWGVVETRAAASGAFGYRFYPHLLKGEGLFMACLRKTGGGARGALPVKAIPTLGKASLELVRPWLQSPEDMTCFQIGDTVRAAPAALWSDITQLSAVLPIREAGVALGQPMRKELIPDPSLALSLQVSDLVPRVALTREQALDYVRKDDLRLEGAPRGWALVTYEGHGLGWVKVLEGRINNYYPKQWRVLKR
jgi:NOL1/NOP2/fmu family ribosome biogenesis protein